MLLAGDVGGTKTNLGIFTPDNGWRHPIAEVTFKSTNFSTLEAMLREFLDSEKVVVRHVSLGVAGPVDNGKARITNLNWTLEDRKLRKALDLDSVRLINDLEAIAYRVPSLGKSDLKTVNKGKSVPEGSKAIVAPGTGLGEAFLTWDEDRYSVHASEGGHSDFAPSSPLEIDLLRYLQARFGQASFERACSGPGMRNIHEFLEERGVQEDKAWHDKEQALDDPVPMIVETALHDKGRCKICEETLEIFVSILAHEASNFALKVKATDGVYLGGGIPPRIIPALTDGLFMKSFGQKGKLADYVKKFPVYVIKNPKVAMEGAARFGISRLEKGA
ncbi:MAG: glucokinase [Nitrososphaerales archaeon]